MGYNINYTDLRAFQNTVNLLIEGWKQNLQWVLEDINALVNSDSYRGQAADSMRLYLQDVTGNITITLINILCEYSGKLNRYIQGFYAYDNGWQAVLNEDAMQAVMDTFSHIIQETMDSYDRIKDSMDSVSDQLPSSLQTQQAYVVSMIGERDSIYRLRESVGEYDAAAGTEQPTLQEEVETLLQIIKQQVENPPCSVTGYTAEVWQATDTYGDLERIYNASHWYINSHERSILEAQQSYIDTLDRIQEDLSKERWEKGYELVMVSSASALSLVLSSGLLTTGTLTAETAALSTVAAAFVYSDYIEGVQEMYYGCVGDISSASVNPLKDTVFGGWEEGYQAAEMLSIGVASYSGMQDIARAEQAAQLEQIYAQKAEQIAYSKVDIDELLKLRQNNGQYGERIGVGGESGRESSIMDYSNRFADSLAEDFNPGVEVRDVVKEDMILVQFSSDAPNASLRYWTTIDEANGISTIEEYMDKMALSKEWGNRNVVKVARVKKGTEVTHAIGTAKAQTKISDPRPGNGKQILFSKFDSNWITEVRNIKE